MGLSGITAWAASRLGPTDRARPSRWAALQPALALAAVPPLALGAAAAFVQPFRPAALLIAIIATVVAARREGPGVWAWAATVPLTGLLCWGLLPAPAAAPDLASCASLLSPPMLWRVAEVLVVLGGAALLARWLPGVPRHLPRERVRAWMLAGAGTAGIVAAPLALTMAAEAARPFFGERHLELGITGAMAPALVFALANATLEEGVYRGVLLGWLEPALGTTGAILAQAAIFGLAHNGTDYIASPLPVIVATFAGGALAGFVVKRTGSLAIPIVIHAALDVPLYYALACRLP